MRIVGSEVHPKYATFGHVIPKSDGGTDALKNLKLSHKKCNNERPDYV